MESKVRVGEIRRQRIVDGMGRRAKEKAEVDPARRVLQGVGAGTIGALLLVLLSEMGFGT